MAISLPPYPGWRAVGWALRSNVVRSRSIYTASVQTVGRPGDYWAATLDVPPMYPRDAGAWAAALAQLTGGREAALIGPPPMRRLPEGFGGAPAVHGAGNVGSALSSRGWTPGAQLLPGDWLSYQTSTFRALHLVTGTATANAQGVMLIPIQPAIRRSPPDGAAVILRGASAEMILDDEPDLWRLEVIVHTGLSIRVVERVTT